MKGQRLIFSVWFFGLVAIATQPARAEVSFLVVSNDKNLLAQDSTNLNVIKVIAIEVIPTDTGIEIFLETETGTTPRPKTRTEGNNLIADIPNAILALPQNDKFQLNNPVAGITSVSVTQTAPTHI